MVAWHVLSDELDAWLAAGRTATLWWRDDDVTEPTAALDRLLGVAAGFGVPLCLAVIPASGEPALAARARRQPGVFAVAHGYAHVNHAASGRRKEELGPERAPATVIAELAAGLERLVALFDERFRPVLVPPWNRLDGALVPRLADAGFAGLSTLGPRRARVPAPGLVQVNGHADIIDWSRRAFRGEGEALERLTAHLRARRLGQADATEPTGLLTHHLILDDEGWAFLDSLFRLTARHNAARWLSVPQAFNLPV